eukprot:3435932-Pleurochrysis_carterae.AAC.1
MPLGSGLLALSGEEPTSARILKARSQEREDDRRARSHATGSARKKQKAGFSSAVEMEMDDESEEEA